MNKELTTVLMGIKQKTGIDVGAFSEKHNITATTKEGWGIIIPSKADFTDIFSDERQSATFFKFSFRNVNFIGFIDGASVVEKNYAYFILSFLENSNVRDANLGRSEYIKSIIQGDLSKGQISKFMRKFAIPHVPCFVLCISAPSIRINDVLSFLADYNSNGLDLAVITEELNCVFVKFLDEKTGEKISLSEYSTILSQTLFEETGIEVKIGMGSVVPSIYELNLSYVQAHGALKMSATFKSNANIHSYKEYVWIKMIEELPKFKLLEYLDLLIDSDARLIFEDEEMLATVDEFIECSLNVSETARKLFMHRNTLMYRLDKIERATGLNIKKFPDAQTFRLVTILNKLVEKK